MNILLPKDSVKKIVIATILGASIFTGAHYYPTYAQQPTAIDLRIDSASLTAIPTRLGDDNSVKVKPGEIRQVQVRVVNSSPQTMSIATEAIDFMVGDDGATPVAITETVEGSNRWSLASWLIMTPTQQTLKPNEIGAINVLIQVPEDALPGGHYAMITHRPAVGEVNAGENQAASGVNQRVGTLLYVVVDGQINEEAYINNFLIPQYLEFGPVPYSFSVDNRSDIHITPQMGLTIKNMLGKTVATLQPETKNIFPFTSRVIEGEWDRIWGFGKYTAELKMSYGEQGKISIQRTSFWLIPIKLVIAIGIILLTLLAVIIAVRRHLIHRKNDQSVRIAELEQKLQEMQKEKLQKFEE